ncbi:hypothetical protein Y017_15040 [Alcanivorax sp. 97CO-5]|uniref:SURF1 family protein n=1 Tax=unclassified Alcanivorax TaxID=2638842 RepID=UPI0003E80534|nr:MULTISPECIES: SURF1 family protein [unclassified Alcanivorax]EUC69374.1 hypothetical protein Y017_15040 [Alcanivorax sp. 97CO-5]PKG01294.1 SURF1 family protein [Alcanivorax sp. 97CO-6]
MPHSYRRAPWVALIATLIVAAICLRLAFWQLERAEEKRLWLTEQNERATLPPADLPTLLADTDPMHRRITITGHFDNAHNVLLDNRTLNGVAGYHLLTPFETREGRWVLINRGWLARGNDRATLPTIVPIEGNQTVHGTAYRPSRDVFVLKDMPLPNNQWPLRVQKVDFDAIGERLGVELPPFEIRVTPELALGNNVPLPRHWQDVTVMGPERHKAYALQWFALALAALLIYVAAALRNRRKARKTREEL